MHDSTARRRMPSRAILLLLAPLLALPLLAGSATAQCVAPVTFEWIDVPGNPLNPNPPDPSAINPDTLQPIGSVGTPFRISKREVTNAQYLTFLNAQALPADPNALYNRFMSRKAQGINFNPECSGCPRYEYLNARYTVIADRAVGNVSYYDALRFANWVNNGCPATPSINANGVNVATDRGAYRINASSVAANAVAREPGALIFLPNEDEWYKAAYYDVATQSYFQYATSSDDVPDCIAVDPVGTNSAGCNRAYNATFAGLPSAVTPPPTGSFPNTISPYGVFDMAGSIQEWLETPRYTYFRVLRGGGYLSFPDQVGSNTVSPFLPQSEFNDVGFRLAARALGSLPGGAPTDQDGDGILDATDNCTLTPNPTQLDSNGDGFGNRCDADYDDDGRVGSSDFTRFATAFLSEIGESTYDPAVDCDGDGQVGGPDFTCFATGFRAGEPGPAAP